MSLSLNSVVRILSIITKMRLQEGFSFAHSASGIFTFLLEVEMKVNSSFFSFTSRLKVEHLLQRVGIIKQFRITKKKTHWNTKKTALVSSSTFFSHRTQ